MLYFKLIFVIYMDTEPMRLQYFLMIIAFVDIFMPKLVLLIDDLTHLHTLYLTYIIPSNFMVIH